MPIVTLLSDFGSQDQYVSEMKATVLTLCPSATLVDISHEIETFNIRMGAFVLSAASRYFPAGTIHVVVVDPGVGGPRRDVLIVSQKAVYIGPDNGILLPAALRDGIKEVYSIENQSFMRTPVSSTFHGRDVFAYAAGKIACGAKLYDVGPRISDLSSSTFAEAAVSHDRIVCEVLVTDSFGNVVTTAGEKDLRVVGFEAGKTIGMRVKSRTYNLNMVKSYSDAAEGAAALLVGSHGFLELAVIKGNAARRFRVRPGDQLIFPKRRTCHS